MTPCPFQGLPKEIATRLNTEVARALALPEHFSDILKRDIPKWTKIVKDANIKANQ